MFASLLLFADAAGAVPVQQQPNPDGGLFFFFIMLPVFLILIWFLFANPQKKQEERLRNMLKSLEKNDRVMTVGGLIGTVHSIDKEQNEIVLKVDETNNTRIRFHLTAVSTVFPKDNAGK